MITGHADPRRAFRGVKKHGSRIVLTHVPGLADISAEHGDSLILAGHTHGGHVVIPKVTAGIARRLGNRYLQGFFRVNGSLLYVNCGIGSSSVPIRAGAPAEVAIFTLRSPEVLRHTHGHAHHPDLQHHFQTLEQQHEASTLGMWLFLVTEVMFFGGLLTAYMVYRIWFPEAWAEGSLDLDIVLGGINTAVLIASSLTMAFAVLGTLPGARVRIDDLACAAVSFPDFPAALRAVARRAA